MSRSRPFFFFGQKYVPILSSQDPFPLEKILNPTNKYKIVIS